MRTFLALMAIIGLALTTVAPLVAHHSRAAEFDEDLAVSFKGEVTRVDWRNPHIWVFVDETDANGTVVHWEAEVGGNPVSMARNGWSRESLKSGDEVVVEGIRAYCCENVMSIGTIQRPNGEAVFAGRRPR